MLFSKLQRLISYLKIKIITILGDIKVFGYPAWIVYDPKSYLLNGKDFAAVTSVLKPGCILLRRYDNYLDNGFIEGFWNHAGVYVGAPGDPYGKVIHSIAEGVRSDTIFDFMKADHVCVLEPAFAFDLSVVQTRLESFVGRPYDFDFNPNYPDKLFCTELAYWAFDGFDHGIKKTTTYLGREAILPDHVLKANFKLLYKSDAR